MIKKHKLDYDFTKFLCKFLMFVKHSVWKLQDCSVIQILREINFRETISSKNCCFGHFWGSEFCSIGKSKPLKSAKIHKNRNSEPLTVLKWQFLDL